MFTWNFARKFSSTGRSLEDLLVKAIMYLSIGSRMFICIHFKVIEVSGLETGLLLRKFREYYVKAL